MTLVPPRPNIGAFDEIGEFALAQARPQAVAQRGHAAIGERGADPHPVDLLGRFDLPQAHIGPVEIGDRAEPRRQHRVLLEGHRPDDADPAVARRALFQYGNGRADRRAAAPGDFGRRRKPPRQRHVIDVLHEQRVRLARRKYADRLGGHRPAGEPLHRRAEPIGAAEDQVIETGLSQQIFDRGAAAGHLAGAKARVFGFVDSPQLRRRHEVIATPLTHARHSCHAR